MAKASSPAVDSDEDTGFEVAEEMTPTAAVRSRKHLKGHAAQPKWAKKGGIKCVLVSRDIAAYAHSPLGVYSMAPPTLTIHYYLMVTMTMTVVLHKEGSDGGGGGLIHHTGLVKRYGIGQNHLRPRLS